MRLDQRVLLVLSVTLSLGLLAYSLYAFAATYEPLPAGSRGRARIIFGLVAAMSVINLVRAWLRYKRYKRAARSAADKRTPA